ncbi:hypothetical protein IW140_000384 [Coemansia sp. RSA 1813]|nr:hypothetical protein EV178_000658 [Coemansia sp. RSA 1646]KAJ1773257.1 hypothetical protein LPJ74_000767 [Coemansia sp. RSA 1843]KAJ2092724.1 hypothetical protein IW138_000818 [Coemansia sp. RSA 986]KAJ2217778.1 hypothetical protein EV179_000264 [Coemansia sp. RSA 487]KAJ2572986.1 hypothetical protein IW140_000384 [Coemansia sp. RSA 1813]
MKVAKCATIGFRLLIGIGCVFASAETEPSPVEQNDPPVHGATAQPAGSFSESYIQPETQTPDTQQSICFECVVRNIVPIDELHIDQAQKEILASQLAEEYARLVDETAESLQRSRIEVANGVESVIRARGGGSRFRSRPRFRPVEFFNSLYNEEGKRFVDRMFDLFKKFVGAYAKAAASDGDSVSPSTSSADNLKNSISQPASTGEDPKKSAEQNPPVPTITTKSESTSKSTSKSRSHSKKSQTSTKSNGNDDEDGDDDDDEDDYDDDDDKDAKNKHSDSKKTPDTSKKNGTNNN